MKTCEGRISAGVASRPMAKITNYGYARSTSSSTVTYLDDNCEETTEIDSRSTSLTVAGRLINGSQAQDEVETMEDGEMRIFPEGETSGLPVWLFTGCTTTAFNVDGAAGGNVGFTATIAAKSVDKTGTVP